MPVEWIRVRDTRTDNILPNLVPRTWLEKASYLKEVPSSRSKKDEAGESFLANPAPHQDTTLVTEPARPKAKPGQKPTNEPAQPGKN